MTNNLRWLIKKAGYTQLRFGLIVLHDVDKETEENKTAIEARIKRYCQPGANIPRKYWDKMAEVLNSDFNEMFGFDE